MIYVVSYHDAELYSVRHSDGFLTLLPQRLRIVSSSFTTDPIVTADRKYVVVGDRDGRIVFVEIDKQGRFTGKVHAAALPGGSQSTMALAYSPKFDLIYARTDESPEQAKQDKPKD